MKVRHWLVLLVVVGIALRIGLAATYEPASYPDTGTYFTAARDLLEGNLARSQGRRTPGYPLAIALCGLRTEVVVWLQFAAGLVTSILLFQIALSLSGRPWLAFAAAVSYDINLQQLYLEATLLSESLSTLAIVGVAMLAVKAIRRIRTSRPATAAVVALGVLSGIAILFRPQFLFLLAIVPLAIFCASGMRWLRDRVAWRNAAAAVVPLVAIVGAWCTFVHAQTGYFALTTQTGFSLVNHSVAFVESAPERYATLRDILLRERAVKFAEQGHFGNTGWLALPEMMRATGMTLPALSEELSRMSLYLFIAHPLRYGESVARSWIDFWSVPILWRTAQVTVAWLRGPLVALWLIEHSLLRIANAAFVGLVVLVLASPRMRARTRWSLELTTIAAIVLASSLTQALADYGASGRYELTTQALVVLVVAIVGFNLARRDRPEPVVARLALSARERSTAGIAAR